MTDKGEEPPDLTSVKTGFVDPKIVPPQIRAFLEGSTTFLSAKQFFKTGLMWILLYCMGRFELGAPLVLVLAGFAVALEENFFEAPRPKLLWMKMGWDDGHDPDALEDPHPPHKVLKVVKPAVPRGVAADHLPAWVMYPDYERVEWLNIIITGLWPKLSHFLDAFVREKVRKDLPDLSHRVNIVQVTLGSIPLRVGGVKVYPGRTLVARDKIVLDVDLDWASNCQATVSMLGGKVGLGVADITFVGNLRIVLGPLVGELPLISGMKLTFLDKPEVNFDLRGLGNVFDTPGVSGIARKVIQEQIAKICAFPNEISLRLARKDVAPVEIFPDVAGVLRVLLVQAPDLAGMDTNLIGANTSDPYVVFSVDDKKPTFKSATVAKTLNPVWNLFGEFTLPMEDMKSRQPKLVIRVWDDDQFSKDDFLGSAELYVSDLANAGRTDLWLDLMGTERGRVRIRSEWLELTKEPNQQGPSDSSIASNQSFAQAVLWLHVDSCSGLPGTSPSTFVVSSLIGNEEAHTDIVPFTRDPVYKKSFLLRVLNPNSDDIRVRVVERVNDDEDVVLGEVLIRVSHLLMRTPMVNKNESYRLEKTKVESYITLSLKLEYLRAPAVQKIPQSAPKTMSGTVEPAGTATATSEPLLEAFFLFQEDLKQLVVDISKVKKVSAAHKAYEHLYFSLELFTVSSKDDDSPMERQRKKTAKVAEAIPAKDSAAPFELLFNERCTFHEVDAESLDTSSLELKLMAVMNQTLSAKREAIGGAVVSISSLDLLKNISGINKNIALSATADGPTMYENTLLAVQLDRKSAAKQP